MPGKEKDNILMYCYLVVLASSKQTHLWESR
jgi:hypothetical protein